MDILTAIILMNGLVWIVILIFGFLLVFFIPEILWHSGHIPDQSEMFEMKRKKTQKDENRNIHKKHCKGVW